MKITRAIVLTGRGTDKVDLCTTMPSPCPAVSDEPLFLRFETPPGDGARYVTQVLGVSIADVEVIRV